MTVQIVLFVGAILAFFALTLVVRNAIPRSKQTVNLRLSEPEFDAVHWAVRKQLDEIMPSHPRHDALYAAKEKIES